MIHKGYKIVNETGVGIGTKIIDIETGEELKNVSKIEIEPIGTDDAIKAKVTIICMQMDIRIDSLEIKKDRVFPITIKKSKEIDNGK